MMVMAMVMAATAAAAAAAAAVIVVVGWAGDSPAVETEQRNEQPADLFRERGGRFEEVRRGTEA